MEEEKIIGLILGSSVIGGVISGLIAQGAPWWRERLAANKTAAFSALRLALLLEEFAGDCASLYGDHDTYRSSRGGAGASARRLPELKEYPSDIAWQALGTDLTTKVLHFRVVRADAGAMISADAEFADQWDHPNLIAETALKIGLKALAVAHDLRRARKLAPAHVSLDRTTEAYLTSALARIAERSARLAARGHDEL
ncbi:hypothetical protein [Caulobacter segnis]|uniref:hypothetical protein n=1 Tax=Caulobacter segnis TaxID=88688 RepID=UPI001CBFB2EE|nr:hypothetical protein [Caulobacter segnis]UAL10157.1 hypothetical protein K8940_20705 [Caulobacter segnis]